MTSGQTLDAATLAAASGAQMDIVPILGVGGPEALLTNVSTPARMHQNEDFTLDVSMQSNEAMSATLRVLAGGTLVAENSIALNKGANSFAVPMKAGRPGFTALRRSACNWPRRATRTIKTMSWRRFHKCPARRAC